jgi:hypothetical protein
MSESQPTLYAGLAHVTHAGDPFDLGHGLTLRSTYAHLMSVHMMAFKKAEQGGHHPPPWRAAHGGFSYDIEAEIVVPLEQAMPGKLNSEDTAWLIAALLRLARYPYLMIPVFSDHPFSDAAMSEREPVLRPFEIEPRILAPAGQTDAVFTAKDLEWVRSV